MELNVTGAKIYFEIPILGGIRITQTTVSSFLVMVILCTAGYFLGRNLKKRPGRLQVVVEKLVGMLYNMVEETMGAHNSHWAPFIGTLFLSSICGTFIGMTGFFRSTTADLSTTITWALMVSVLIWYHNIKNNGFLGWLKGFTEPIVVMTPMNIVSEIAQPISLAFRHFGNIAGGGIITTMLYAALSAASAAILNRIASSGTAVAVVLLAAGVVLLVFGIRRKKLVLKIFGALFFAMGLFAVLQIMGWLSGVPILEIGIPAILSLYFDIFSGGVQALVFSLLTMVYVSGACPPPAELSKENS